MCWQVLPMILSAAGSAAGMANENSAQRQRDQLAAEGVQRQADIRRQSESRVQQEIQKVKASTPDAERQAAQQDFMTALQRAKLMQGGAGLATPAGAVSQRFATDVGSARTAAGTEAANTASNLAAIDAPTYQRIQEGQSRASAASDLSLLGSKSAGEDYLTQLRIANARGNPWIGGLSQGLTAFGGALATRAPKTKPVAGTPIPLSPGGNYSYAIPGG